MHTYISDDRILRFMKSLVGLHWDEAEALAKISADELNIDFEENKEELTSLASYAIRENY